MSGFRVVVLGAGPGGLFTAHALAAAGIDFIVLERQPEIERFRGALLVAWPPTMRLMDQLGLYEAMLKISTRIISKTHVTHDGQPLCSGPLFDAMEKELGYPSLGFSRGNLLRVLYEALPDRKTKVRANANAARIEEHQDGVRVHLEDGDVVEGSIVIAADGVHSLAREYIQRHGELSSDAQPLQSPMSTTYLTIFGKARGRDDDIALGDFVESHGPGIASQSLRLLDATFFTVLKRLPKPAAPSKRKFTREELDGFVADMGDVTIFPGITLREIWPSRETGEAVLLHQEEGIAESWHHGRVAIVGDAAHKMTSVNGQGAMTAFLSATVLVNELRRALLGANQQPSTEDIEGVFAKYQQSRMQTAAGVVGFGAAVSRFITWGDEGNEAQDRENSRQEGRLVGYAKSMYLPLFRESPILDFIPFESKQGASPWAMESVPPSRPSSRPRL
ncbi:hypothetical protein F4777DRAFT_371274 [Nemania sp. FL0916]|nr:hypothetical protein F4777DRAFT_371274 [Nemania sp. FL0916]